MRSFLQNVVSVLGALGFVVCMAMLLTRPTNFASYLPEIVEVIEETFEDPTVHIVIDAGHGGIDGGTSNQTLLEKDLALTVARLVQEGVKAARLENVEVLLTRKDDTYLSLHQRVALANKHARCYFVSIHFNASRHRSASGTETFYASPKPSIIENQIRRHMRLPLGAAIEDPRGERFAQTMQRSLVEELGSRDRGIRNNGNFVLPREIIGPSIIVECVFLSNPGEALKLHRRSYLERVAKGITDGILEYVDETSLDPFAGVTYTVPQEEEGEPAIIGPAS